MAEKKTRKSLKQLATERCDRYHRRKPWLKFFLGERGCKDCQKAVRERRRG